MEVGFWPFRTAGHSTAGAARTRTNLPQSAPPPTKWPQKSRSLPQIRHRFSTNLPVVSTAETLFTGIRHEHSASTRSWLSIPLIVAAKRTAAQSSECSSSGSTRMENCLRMSFSFATVARS